jgi:hypothetical protein
MAIQIKISAHLQKKGFFLRSHILALKNQALVASPALYPYLFADR